MYKRFSEMDKQELEAQLLKFKEELMKKHQAGFFSEAAILEQKFYMAKSYLLDPSEFIPGTEYKVTGYEGLFHIDYIDGIMAWGTFEGSEQMALPIARLEV